ncbi:MAG TPA: HDIG domain-containing protein [Candidatus Saccharimonadales bacterium]|nr:HDIG domain-containing protein [Candidatus Saccharimonadales bacterium]
MSFPTDKAILDLHKKYAPTEQSLAVVYGHCQIIEKIAAELIKRNQLKVDTKLVHAAALLHDIGYYPLLDKNGYEPKGEGIKHGVTGAEMLRKEGVGEAICRIAERHTGVGLTRGGILKFHLPLPARDFIPETAEEWLVAYADKLHSKSILVDEPHDILGWFNRPETYLEYARRFGEENAARFAELVKKYGAPDLAAMANEYRQPLK